MVSNQPSALKWVSNTYDPKAKDAKMFVFRMPDETQEHAWRTYLQWLNGKVIGEPQATDHYTVEQLKAMGLVGVYVQVEDYILTGKDAKDFIGTILEGGHD